ncbi:MAG: nucleoside kinase [Lachnospiraceae bacterium]|nr:nucleoside kinase [Lachnospiraceae bacterium]
MANIRVKVCGEEREYPEGTQIMEIAEEYKKNYKHDIVLAMMNNKLCELNKLAKDGKEISFVTVAETCGNQAYRRSVTLLMLKAFYDVCGKQNIEKITVHFSLSKGYYCTLKGNVKVTKDLLIQVKKHMSQMVFQNLPISKRALPTDEAIERFKKHGMYDKEKLFKFRKSSTVNVYSLNGFEDYYYGYMVPSTGYLKYFELYQYDEGFVLQMPVKEEPEIVPPFKPQNKLFGVLKEADHWGDMLEVNTVGALNEQIAKGNINDLILVQEALQEKKIAQIAQQICERSHVKFVMIAGPSSSGKTTFSKRLAIQLRTLGKKVHTIGVDDYFVDREKTPRDENGDYNFEILEALDVEQFNKDMTALKNGEEVKMPTFNFKTGKREYKGNTLKLNDGDVLVIEGIHCLNDALSYTLEKDCKFKIYISALTTLNVDEHNRIPTTDGRLIRRMVRDARTRATGAEDTIARWPSVRRGEENNIFPFQEEADVMFNSALCYELSVLKQYAEPLLFSIPTTSPYYAEAKRLIKFLDYFLGVSSESIPSNSLLREFAGGGCFHV